MRATLAAALLGSALIAAPAAAQHQGHAMSVPGPGPTPTTVPAPDDPHAGHAMPAETEASAPDADDPHADHAMSSAPVDDMDGMDHGAMDAASPPSPGPDFETPPPPEAGSGPPRAADAIWGADAMRASRDELQRTHGDFPVFWFQGDRFETQVRDGANGYLWDLQGYYGGPTSRFWFKSEGEGVVGDRIEDAEVQALYARAIAPFWDLQAGVRQDFAGPDTTYGVIGVQGLSPYMFEVDAALFVSHRGDITARVEAEVDQRITQRLILQPRAEVNLSAQDVPRLGIGSGIDTIEIGARLRYEIVREFAPYIGIEQSWRVGGSAEYARARGEDPSVTSYLVGIRFWF